MAEREKPVAEGEARPRVGGPRTGTRLSAREIHDNVRLAAEEELDRSARALLWSSLAAGLSIERLLGEEHVAGEDDDDEPERVRGGCTEPRPLRRDHRGGVRRAEEADEPVIPLLNRRTGGMLRRVLRLWGIVLAGNLAGAFIFAWLFARTPIVDAPLRAAMLEISAGGGGPRRRVGRGAGVSGRLRARAGRGGRRRTARFLSVFTPRAPPAMIEVPACTARLPGAS
jgi:hypothetical protein